MQQINERILSTLSAQEVLLLDEFLDRLQASANELSEASAPWPAADRRRGRSARRGAG